MLAEVSRELDALDAGIRHRKILDHLPRAVVAAICYEQDLEIGRERRQGRANAHIELGENLGFAKHRRNDAEPSHAPTSSEEPPIERDAVDQLLRLDDVDVPA